MADKTFLDSTGVAQLLFELKTKINGTFAKKTEITDFVKSSALNNYKTSAATTQEIEQAKNDIIGKVSDDTTANTIYALKKKLQEKADNEGNATQEWVTKQIDSQFQQITLPDNFSYEEDGITLIDGSNEKLEQWINFFNAAQNLKPFMFFKLSRQNNIAIILNSSDIQVNFFIIDIKNFSLLTNNFNSPLKLITIFKYTDTDITYYYQKVDTYTTQTDFDNFKGEIRSQILDVGDDIQQNLLASFDQKINKITSESGKTYQIVVDDEGQLSTTLIT